MESFSDGLYSEQYTYNAFGLLSGVANGSESTTFAWDILNGDGQILSAMKNGTVTDYTYGLDRISGFSKGTRTEYVTDITGSVIGEIESAFLNKTAVTSKSYSPFGETDSGSGFGFKGEYYNSATGLVYLRARFYAPEMNRFSQKDAYRGITASTISLNRYAYCYNDPVNYKDPSGKLGLLAGAAIVGGIVGGVVGAVKSIATQKASGGTVSVKTVIKSAAVGVVAGAVGAVVATAATVALATTFGAATITGTASLTLAQSIGVGSISAALGGIASRGAGAIASNTVGAGPYVNPVSSAFNSTAMLNDLVFGGVAGAATGYAADGTYQTYESLRYEQNIKYTSSRTADSPETETPKSLGIRSCNGKDLAKNADELDDAITATRSASVSESIADSGREAFELSNPSSNILRKNMIESGVEPPKYSNAAHHIVAGNSKNAAEARAILQKYEIDINDASNRVFLPTVKDVTESAYHPSLHTNSYYEKVTDMLRTATSREDAIEILQDIGEQLSLGIF